MASSRKLHPDELDIDEALVRRMVAEQFPQWAGLPVEPVEPAGTSNAMYRLGAELVVEVGFDSSPGRPSRRSSAGAASTP
ncbi:hypothetical protein ACIQOV_18000, partial [Kitasatospora sp. NPDC091257]